MTLIEIREIEDENSPVLQFYTEQNETQLKHYYEPHGGLFIAETEQVILRALGAGYIPVSFLAEKRYLDKLPDIMGRMEEPEAADLPVPVYTAPMEILIRITGYHLTKGLLCLMKRRPLPSVDELCRDASRLAVLEKVTNPTNIGAVFRSAAALGMDGVLLSADCCDPLYRRAVRVSLGTVFQIPWTIMPSGRKEEGSKQPYWPSEGMKLLHGYGFKTAAMALSERAVSIEEPSIWQEEKLAVILGNEAYGLSGETLLCCDREVCIPMQHGVDSLNVAAAGAVVFWQLRKRTG